MSVEEHEFRVRRSIEEQLGVEEAAYVIEGRPPGGWGAIVTKEYLDLRLAALEARLEGRLDGRVSGVRTEIAALRGDLRTEMERQTKAQLRWLVPTLFAGLTAVGAIVAIFD